MSKLDWTKADRFERDAGAVTSISDYEMLPYSHPLKRRGTAGGLSATERKSLLDRSEQIRLAELAKKKARLAKLASGAVSRWKEEGDD